MITLGLSGLPHAQKSLRLKHPQLVEADSRICQGLDSAAALVLDGEVIAAAAEERFTGDKGTGAFPANAISYCLNEAGVGRLEVDAVVHCFNYDRLTSLFRENRDFDQVYSSRSMLDGLSETGWNKIGNRFSSLDHHLAHAHSTFDVSPFEEALVIVSDGMGESESTSVFVAKGGELKRRYRASINSSLGIFYSICTRFLGFTFNQDEYKVMGLAPYGDASRYRAELLALFDTSRPDSISLRWRRGLLDANSLYRQTMDYFATCTGLSVRQSDEPLLQVHKDFAAGVQSVFSTVLKDFVAAWVRKVEMKEVCLAGGVFLNCSANAAISAEMPTSNLFIQPAAGDDGAAVGAALAVNKKPRAAKTCKAFSVFLGPSYSREAVSRVLASYADLQVHDLDFSEDYTDAAAADLVADSIIGWFHGRMEFGPRALGNRSILALPSGQDVKARINSRVKFREEFRPFAPALLKEEFNELIGCDTWPMRYMLTTVVVPPAVRGKLAAGVHEDGTARVQVVHDDETPLFAKLLRTLRARTGVGAVINTSLNVKGQPLIMAPREAVEMLRSGSLDRLYIEGFQVSRRGES